MHGPSLDAVHGGLLALGELLRHTGEGFEIRIHGFRGLGVLVNLTRAPSLDAIHGSLLLVVKRWRR